MYILECVDGTYYTGSTIDLERRLEQHQNGEGANYTQKRLPVKLVYFEEFGRIDDAFYREKQVQGWSRAKKEALIDNNPGLLHDLAECKNDSHFTNAVFDSAQSAKTIRSLSVVETNVVETNNTAFTVDFGSAQSTKPVRSLSGAETTDAQVAKNRSLSGAETTDNEELI